MSAWTTPARIAARVTAAGILTLVTVFAVAQRFDVTALTTDETTLSLALLFSLIGLLLLAVPPYEHRRRIVAGAIISLVGIAAFYVVNFQQSEQWPGGWVLPIFFLPGIVELICTFASSRKDAVPN